jgi:hypothetical protein
MQTYAIGVKQTTTQCHEELRYATMRTKDPDVFDRVQRAYFDDGSQAATTYDSGLL